jgi:uncharacterized protein YqgC (DUF456 family)
MSLKSAQSSSTSNNAKQRVYKDSSPSNKALKGALTGGYIGARFPPYGIFVGTALGAIVGFIVDEVND